MEAKNYEKEFILFAITADYYYKKEKFKSIPQKYRSYIKWINWQSVPFVLEKILETNTEIKLEEKNFAYDLCQLLDQKCLRSFHGIIYKGVSLEIINSIFFDAKTAKLRGDFIGFLESFSSIRRIKPKPQIVFFDSSKKRFKPLSELKKMHIIKSPIFFKYSYMIEDIKAAQNEVEGDFFAMQSAVEMAALELYKKDPALAIKYLTNYSNDCANKAVDTWWKLADELVAKYDDGYINQCLRSSRLSDLVVRRSRFW